MSRIFVRTVYGADLQTARHLGRPHEIQQYTTINEAINDSVLNTHLPAVVTRGMEVTAAYDANVDTQNLNLRVFCIGNGGHANVAGPTGGVPYTRPVPHKASDAGLYHQIPFVVRQLSPINEDLDVTQRAKYRLRRTIEVGGNLYAAYFGKVLDFSTTITEKLLLTTVNGVTTQAPFVPTVNNLRPQAPTLSSPTTGTFLEVSAGTVIPFTAEEVRWLREACDLLYLDENYAIISEIALCSGVDKEVTQKYPNSGTQTLAPSVGGPFYETVACQANVHISTYHPMVFNNSGLDLSYDVGATEPLFGTNLS